MPISSSSIGSTQNDADTYSLISQVSSALTIGDSLPDQLVRKSARKGFTFNIMSVGPSDMNKTVVLSALFGKNLEIHSINTDESPSDVKDITPKDPQNPAIYVVPKTFDIEEKRVRLRLTIAESKCYGDALCLTNTHIPLVEYIDKQFADYHRRESSYDRRNIKDKMIHCLFFFISPYRLGLSALDLEFLQSVHDRVNIIPIIARAENLTVAERSLFKRRVMDDLKRHNINIYRINNPDPDDPEDLKKMMKEIQDAMPFAISTMSLKPDNTPMPRCLEWGQIDPYDLNHSDFPLLKSLLQIQIPDLCEITHEEFYEKFRLRMMDKERNSCHNNVKGDSPSHR